MVYSEQTAEEKKQETLEGVIENFVNNGNYTESMRDLLRSIKDVFDVTVEHAPFIIEDSEFEHLKQLLMNGNIIDKAMKKSSFRRIFRTGSLSHCGLIYNSGQSG